MDSASSAARSVNGAVAGISPDRLPQPGQTSPLATPPCLETTEAEICCLLVASATEGMYGVDAEGITTLVNPALLRLTGWEAEDLLGKPCGQFVPGFSLAEEKPRQGDDALFLRKDGSSFPAAYTRTPMLRHGRLSATVVVFHDISESRRAQQWEHTRSVIFAAILSHQDLHATLRMLADAFVARFPEKSIAVYLRRAGQLELQAETGLPHRGSDAPDILPPFPDLPDGLALALALPLRSELGEDRGLIAIFANTDEALDDGMRGTIQRVCDLACVAIEHQHLYEELAYRTEADQQVSPSRLALENGLREAIVGARRRGKRIAVCCLDLERLKQIDESLGHAYSDALIQAVSDRLNETIRDVDMPARYAGAGFVLALCELSQPEDAEEVCQRLVRALAAPFLIKGRLLSVSANAGISLFPEHGETPGLLLHEAGIALQAVKLAGRRGGTLVYSPALGLQSRRAAEMPEALLSALKHGEFRMAYQPIYDMSKEIVGFEALLRWKHPDWGFISPLDFVGIAEKTGLIVAIGDWVIREVCRQAVAWDRAHLPPVKLFANVSGVQLELADFSAKIAQALRESGLSPSRLEIEITESWVISDLKSAARKLLDLRELGIGIAIDDFGTGYSTFNYLQELPIDTLKLDRSFIHRLDGEDAKPSTVHAITRMAQQLGLKIVAEGVETEEQAAGLREIGCDFMQGFFLGRPLEPADASALLSQQRISKTLYAADRVAKVMQPLG